MGTSMWILVYAVSFVTTGTFNTNSFMFHIMKEVSGFRSLELDECLGTLYDVQIALLGAVHSFRNNVCCS